MANVLINGRTAVHKDSGGKVITLDVCLTKTGSSVSPIPYTNVAESSDADKAASSVLINGQPACHKDAVFKKSRGDEPGDRKGVKSGKKGAEASFIMGSANVLIEGSAAARALDMMVSNKANTPPSPLLQAAGMPPLPSQPSPIDDPELQGDLAQLPREFDVPTHSRIKLGSQHEDEPGPSNNATCTIDPLSEE